jgi:glucose-1-phosphate adenylyltransferase
MLKKECVAMLLAGGQGSRLGHLTKHIAKPGVSFGGKYRIIDFSLSNCVNSGIDTVGIMTQYRPMLLNSYVGTGAAWDLDIPNGGVTILPPYATSSSFEWYKGTADAVYQNIDYISQYEPDYVLILSGDHLYRMDYAEMLQEHKDNDADLTISAIEVPWEEAPRFGILTTDEKGKITKFSEKPKEPDSNLASMGIYIFNWKLLRQVLIDDHEMENTSHDFGKDIIPQLLAGKFNIFAYRFSGYWKDIGTIDSYYNASLELLNPDSMLGLFNPYEGRILSNINNHSPEYIGPDASIKDSIICTGSEILGKVNHSVISTDVKIAEGAVIDSSVILPGVKIGKGSRIVHAIVAEDVSIGNNVQIGDPNGEIAVVGDDITSETEERGAE